MMTAFPLNLTNNVRDI